MTTRLMPTPTATEEPVTARVGVAIRVQCPEGGSPTVTIDNLFVSIDLANDLASVVHDCRTALHWQEISRRDAELLVAMGARALVEIGP